MQFNDRSIGDRAHQASAIADLVILKYVVLLFFNVTFAFTRVLSSITSYLFYLFIVSCCNLINRILRVTFLIAHNVFKTVSAYQHNTSSCGITTRVLGTERERKRQEPGRSDMVLKIGTKQKPNSECTQSSIIIFRRSSCIRLQKKKILL